jgi:hypothetical protein
MEIVDNILAKPGSIALIPLTAEAVEGIDLKPGALAQFLLTHLRGGTDLRLLAPEDADGIGFAQPGWDLGLAVPSDLGEVGLRRCGHLTTLGR